MKVKVTYPNGATGDATIKAKVWDTGKNKWTHGTEIGWEDGVCIRRQLGPCPACGSITSNYGGSFSCHDQHCMLNSDNFTCGPSQNPSWWTEDIYVKIDGGSWCAYRGDFVDLQESDAGFGKSPRDAVVDLLQSRPADPAEQYVELIKKDIKAIANIYPTAFNLYDEPLNRLAQRIATTVYKQEG